jgi:transcriptional regulator of arginine metabolism
MHDYAHFQAMPLDPQLRAHRHRQILTLLRRGRIASQEELAARLRARGIAVTQPSLSRDLRDLGVAKVDGRYLAPPMGDGPSQADREEIALFLRAVRPAGPHLTVVVTTVGAAQTVGLAIDRAGWPEVVGTVAGDDTVFVATGKARDQKRLIAHLDRIVQEDRQ